MNFNKRLSSHRRRDRTPVFPPLVRLNPSHIILATNTKSPEVPESTPWPPSIRGHPRSVEDIRGALSSHRGQQLSWGVPRRQSPPLTWSARGQSQITLTGWRVLFPDPGEAGPAPVCPLRHQPAWVPTSQIRSVSQNVAMFLFVCCQGQVSLPRCIFCKQTRSISLNLCNYSLFAALIISPTLISFPFLLSSDAEKQVRLPSGPILPQLVPRLTDKDGGAPSHQLLHHPDSKLPAVSQLPVSQLPATSYLPNVSQLTAIG